MIPGPDAKAERSLMRKRIVALCYDFDKTLAPDDMQAFTFIPSVGMEIDAFWKESERLARENGMDRNLAWMKLMLDKAQQGHHSIERSAFEALGKAVPLYPGVEQWFSLINREAAALALEAEHYIISSGLKEIIEGSAIAPHIRRIYASSFYYSKDNIARWPAQAINYTNKTQYIFRIAKGAFDENDERVNASYSDEELYLPYENMIYIGDSDTDIPCMRLVKSKGGTSIGVYDPLKNKEEKIHRLFREGRINYFAPSDYREGGGLHRILSKTLRLIAAREDLFEEESALRNRASRRQQNMKD